MIIGMMTLNKNNKVSNSLMLVYIVLQMLVLNTGFSDELSLNDLMQEFSNIKQSRATFIEEKKYSLLDDTIIIKGTLTYTAPDKLVKIIEYPHKEIFDIKADKIMITKQSEQQSIMLSQYPVVEMFVESYRGLLSGDLNKLEKYYLVNFKGVKNKKWIIELTPNNEESLEIINKIIINGTNASVDTVLTQEDNGDSTMLIIDNVSSSTK